MKATEQILTLLQKIVALTILSFWSIYSITAFEPILAAKQDIQFTRDWLSNRPVNIEDSKKWEFKSLRFNQNYVQLLESPNKVIVMGSSHVMFIRESHIYAASQTKKIQPHFFNHWITGINYGLDLYEGIYQSYKDKQIFPKVIILGVDPWLLQQEPSKTKIATNWTQSIVGVFFTPAQQAAAKKILSFQNTIKAIFPSEFTTIKPMKVDHLMNRDGSFTCAPDVIICHWSDREAQIRKVNEGLSKNVDIFSQPIHPPLQEQFEKLIDNMSKNGSQVVFVMTPIHPLIYEKINTMPNLRALDAYFRATAKKSNIPLVGSFDPSMCNLTTEDFVDSDHLNDIGTAKLFSQPNCTVGPWAEVIAAALD